MKSILVTNTGDRTQSAKLISNPNLQVTFVTEERFVDMYPLGTDIIVVENLNEPSSSVKQVLQQRNCNHYEAVISLSERAAPTASYLRSYLGIKGPTFDTVNNCTNKYAMKRKFRDAGVPTANFSIAHSIKEVAESAKEVGWPIIVKPVVGAGADSTRVFHDIDELYDKQGNDFFQVLSSPKTTSEKEFPVIVEHYLDVQQELHCDGFVENGKVVFAIVSRYLRPVLDYSSDIFGSYTIPSEDALGQSIIEMHKRIVQSVGIQDSVTHFEVFITTDGIIAGEIACRPGGGGIKKMLELQSGFDSWDAHIATSLGQKYLWEKPKKSKGNMQIAQIMLPSKRGRVISISNEKDFSSIPGLLEVKMNLKTGDVVDGLMDSSSISGLLFVQFDNPQELENILNCIREAFYLKVEANNQQEKVIVH